MSASQAAFGSLKRSAHSRKSLRAPLRTLSRDSQRQWEASWRRKKAWTETAPRRGEASCRNLCLQTLQQVRRRPMPSQCSCVPLTNHKVNPMALMKPLWQAWAHIMGFPPSVLGAMAPASRGSVPAIILLAYVTVSCQASVRSRCGAGLSPAAAA